MEKSNVPIMYMLIGLPGSGKTHLTRNELSGIDIHSSDSIRQELTGDPTRQDVNAKVFEILHKRVINSLSRGESCVYDATNISWKYRKSFLQQLNMIECRKVAVVLATPFEVCVERNNSRERKVPYDVLLRMYKNFDIPYYNEGWDEIIIHYGESNWETLYGSISEFITSQKDNPHNNPHHHLTIGEHCDYCNSIYRNSGDKHPFLHEELLAATALHDCGKPFCKTFKDSKGSITDTAHYYNHEQVGSYNSLFYDKGDIVSTLEVSALIRWHMLLHFFKDWEQKTRDKYFKEFNCEALSATKFWEALQMLYSADKQAH